MTADDTFSVMALVEFYKYCMVRPNKVIDVMIGKFQAYWCTLVLWIMIIRPVLGFDTVSCLASVLIG